MRSGRSLSSAAGPSTGRTARTSKPPAAYEPNAAIGSYLIGGAFYRRHFADPTPAAVLLDTGGNLRAEAAVQHAIAPHRGTASMSDLNHVVANPRFLGSPFGAQANDRERGTDLALFCAAVLVHRGGCHGDFFVAVAHVSSLSARVSFPRIDISSATRGVISHLLSATLWPLRPCPTRQPDVYRSSPPLTARRRRGPG